MQMIGASEAGTITKGFVLRDDLLGIFKNPCDKKRPYSGTSKIYLSVGGSTHFGGQCGWLSS